MMGCSPNIRIVISAAILMEPDVFEVADDAGNDSIPVSRNIIEHAKITVPLHANG